MTELLRYQAEEMKQTPKLSIFGTVRRLREQRYNMVKEVEQYLFLYRYMTEWIQRNRDALLI